MQAKQSRSAVNSSASHVFDVLRFVSTSSEPLGVTEISRRLQLPASTVYRALSTLEETDYIHRFQNTPRFELAAMPHLLSRALFSQFPLHRESRKHLHRLAQATGETVSLWVRIGWYATRIAGAFGSNDVYHTARLGKTTLLHEGAAAQTILTTLPTEERQRYRAFVLRHFAEHQPPQGWDSLEGVITRALKRGYAGNSVAMAPGFETVAVPVRGENQEAIASIMVDGPVLRSGQQEIDPRIIETRNALEDLIRSDPNRFRSPFAHLPPDEIVIAR